MLWTAPTTGIAICPISTALEERRDSAIDAVDGSHPPASLCAKVRMPLRSCESLLLATSGSQDHVSGTSAYPPTGDIRWPMSVFVRISSAYMRRLLSRWF